MTLLADLLSTVFERRYRRNEARPANQNRSLTEMADSLIGTAGETSGLALAGDILARFHTASDETKLAFFRYLAEKMDIDPAAVRETLQAYEQNPTKASYRAFATSAEPARQELIRRLNAVPGATGALVKMRSDLLRLGRDEPELEALDLDFRHLFSSWFNRGFLVLRPISWESPAHILEKIIAYEAVHAINSWEELRNRLEPSDRRCFAFFHPSMPDEPLIFVEVALTKGIARSIQLLLSEDRESIAAEEADTAIFYSISNCQEGLLSISFGSSLIKQVASDLAAEIPGIKTFATLSPIPELARWLEKNEIEWDVGDPEKLKSIAASYLLHAKANTGQPFDPVARFHLGNGAILHAVHAQADTSDKGMAQSGGTMVNYLYDLDRVGQNHEAFAAANQVIASKEVKSLAAPFEPQSSTKR